MACWPSRSTRRSTWPARTRPDQSPFAGIVRSSTTRPAIPAAGSPMAPAIMPRAATGSAADRDPELPHLGAVVEQVEPLDQRVLLPRHLGREALGLAIGSVHHEDGAGRDAVGRPAVEGLA